MLSLFMHFGTRVKESVGVVPMPSAAFAGNSGIGETGKVTGGITSGISSELELAFDS
jgi:hypothetical protein